MPNAIEIHGVTKTYGPKVAVDDLNLTIPEGALWGFIGPNGAGKTTTIRMIMSIIFADRGDIRVLGHPSALDAKDQIGYLPEERGVYKKMRVGSFLKHIGTLKGIPSAELGKRVTAWLERVGLGDVEKKRCEELSKGMQQKVQFIAAVLHRPRLLILDEPFSGLDPVNTRLLRELFLEEHKRGATILFSTHVMFQAEQICDHIVMINQGKKVIDDSVAGLRAKHDPRTIVLEPLDGAFDLTALSRVNGVTGVTRRDRVIELALGDGANPQAVIRDAVAIVPPLRIEVGRPTLEDVFISIVASAESDDEVERLRAALREKPAAIGEATR
ncbi:MAG: ATP-binding cassette domain-containing protein [Acidobacteria bacterium]|nr:ATP-binding cassette domain-containing protein [Acidobacteriota bacterium]